MSRILTVLTLASILVGNLYSQQNETDRLIDFIARHTSTVVKAGDEVPPAVIDVCVSCQRLAGHPSDPSNNGFGPGASDAALHEQEAFDKAIAVCFEAVEQCPDTAGVLFAMGRLYFIAGYEEEALDFLQRASAQGNFAADAYIGELTEEIEDALPHYQTAIENGFEPAVDMMAARLNAIPPEIDFSRFNFPPIVKALYENDIAYLDSLELLPYIYLGGFHTMISDKFVGCPTLIRPTVIKGLALGTYTKFMQFLANGRLEAMLGKLVEDYNEGGPMGGAMWMINASMDLEVFKQGASQDALIVVNEFGCDTEFGQRIKAGIEAFLIR